MLPLNERGDINAASIGIYLILTIILCFIFRNNGIGHSIGLLFVFLFTVVKLVGSCMTVYVQTTMDMSLYTPAAIIGTVVLSPLIKKTIESFRSPTALIGPKFIIATRMVIFSALAVGVTGGLKIFTTNTTPEGIQQGQILLRTAAGLGISSWMLIYGAIILFYPERHCMGTAYPIIACMIMPVFTVRLAYGCAVASTFYTDLTQVFNPLAGNWIVYMVMAFIPEVFISGSLVGIGLVNCIGQKR
ncbi:hypothetical protein BGHDH14_bghG007329000001001 [Blumeria hordei DH14]|uniref:DUF7702 domain-containing protein n=1 Tax=Blumeria graminis f. sp. hordei (strain DH14) TaxID=546991 RepID=N1JKZ7_BLUG1|nr:hypothetical protein BGHDH14_bghG007329000001001 [Blumeria hordei DH14]